MASRFIPAFEAYVSSCLDVLAVQSSSVCVFAAFCLIPKIRNRVRLSVRQLGDTLSDLLQTIIELPHTMNEIEFSKVLIAKADVCRDALSGASATLHSSMRGTQSCISGIVLTARVEADMESCARFSLAHAFGPSAKATFNACGVYFL